MGLKIGGHLFSGPFDLDKAKIRKHQKPVVFGIISREGKAWDPIFRIIDIDQSEPDGIVFAKDKRMSKWAEEGGENISVYYLEDEDGLTLTDEGRTSLVKKLRESFPPPYSTVSVDGMM